MTDKGGHARTIVSPYGNIYLGPDIGGPLCMRTVFVSVWEGVWGNLLTNGPVGKEGPTGLSMDHNVPRVRKDGYSTDCGLTRGKI